MTAIKAPVARVRKGYRPEDGYAAVADMAPPLVTAWNEVDPWQQRSHYQWLAFDLSSGEVWFGDTGLVEVDRVEALLPGTAWLAPTGTELLDQVLVGLVSSLAHPAGSAHNASMRARVLHSAETLHNLVARVLPRFQDLLDHLHRVGPAGEPDWSPESLTAWFDIAAACRFESRSESGRALVTWPEVEHSQVQEWICDTADFVAAHPNLIPAEWALASDEELDAIATWKQSHGSGGVYGRMLQGIRGKGAWAEVQAKSGARLAAGRLFLGGRAALYAYREQAAGKLKPVAAETWLTREEEGNNLYVDASGELGVPIDLDDAGLTRLAERIQAGAAERGLMVTGLNSWLVEKRRAGRETLAKELIGEGAEVKRLEAMLTTARGRRAAILTRILTWEDGRSDHELGRLASMSHTAVANLRDRLQAELADDDAV